MTRALRVLVDAATPLRAASPLRATARPPPWAACATARHRRTAVGPPAENTTPGGPREQRGAKKNSRKKGVCGVFAPMGLRVVLVFFFEFCDECRTLGWFCSLSFTEHSCVC
jgi:hypothetical protein